MYKRTEMRVEKIKNKWVVLALCLKIRYDINGVIHYLFLSCCDKDKKVLDTKPSIYTKGFKTPKISKGESDAQDFTSRR